MKVTRRFLRSLLKGLPALLGAIAVSWWATAPNMPLLSDSPTVPPATDRVPSLQTVLRAPFTAAASAQGIEIEEIEIEEIEIEDVAVFSLTGSSPANEEMDVSITAPIELEFSQTLADEFDSLELAIDPPASLAFNSTGNRIVLEPTAPFQFSTTYTLTIPSQDVLPLLEDVIIIFGTEPQYTYEYDIKALLDASCVGCHQTSGRARASLLDSYEATLNYVNPGSARSELIDRRWTRRHAPIARARRFITNPSTGESTQITSGSPEINYVRLLGYPIEGLGQWTSDQVDIVRTWIVQDKAAEASETRAMRGDAL